MKHFYSNSCSNIEFENEWLEEAKGIVERLPGETFDAGFGTWDIHQTRSSFKLRSFYKLFDSNGYTNDIIHYTVIVPKDCEKDFVLQFSGRRSQRLAKKIRIREYLEDAIFNSILREKDFFEFYCYMPPF